MSHTISASDLFLGAFEKVVRHLEQHSVFWRRSNGSDHMFLVPEDHGWIILTHSYKDCMLTKNSMLTIKKAWINQVLYLGQPNHFLTYHVKDHKFWHNRKQSRPSNHQPAFVSVLIVWEQQAAIHANGQNIRIDQSPAKALFVLYNIFW